MPRWPKREILGKMLHICVLRFSFKSLKKTNAFFRITDKGSKFQDARLISQAYSSWPMSSFREPINLDSLVNGTIRGVTDTPIQRATSESTNGEEATEDFRILFKGKSMWR